MLCALALSGCNTAGQQASVGGTRGATVAFDSIDGPPREVFDRLVRDLNTEAHARQLAVVSRDGSAAYRVRGYLVAERSPHDSAINWVWDVYDGRRQRVLRLAGTETIKGKHPDAWAALDDPAVRRIATSSMDQLATFLTSPDAVPVAGAQVAYGSESSPEAAGIFRIIPVSAAAAPAPADSEAADAGEMVDVPLPPQRPRRGGAVALAMPRS
jgi:hypothetical protein